MKIRLLWFALWLVLVCFVQTSTASTDFVVPPGPGDYPVGIVTGPDGNLWFTNSNSRSIGRINPATGAIARFPVSGALSLWEITNGPDGNLWFTDFKASLIGKITIGGEITTFALTEGAQPIGIRAGPDGALWFTEFGAAKIGRITVDGVISEFATGTNSVPYKIAAGPDGNLWFTDRNSRIVKVTPQGAMTAYAVTGFPFGIAAAPDGNLWFTSVDFNGAIARITPSGVITKFKNPPGSGLHAGDSIAVGPDGNLWTRIRDLTTRQSLARVDLMGNIIEFTLPGEDFSGTSDVTAGPDGALWIAGLAGFDLGRVDTAGNLTDTYTLNHGSGVDQITTGPDGKLWFTEFTSKRVGHISADGGTLVDFPLNDDCVPVALATGSDRALWFTSECGPPFVTGGHLNRAGIDGTISSFAIKNEDGGNPRGIVTGPDGNLWVTDNSYVERFTPTIPPAETDFLVLSPSGSVELTSITVGPDGNLWFVDDRTGAVGRIGLDGAAIVYPPPVVNGQIISADGIVTGSDGNLWFNLAGLSPEIDYVARITTSGVISTFSQSSRGVRASITAGPDGDLWIPDGMAGIVPVDPSGVSGIPVKPTYPNGFPDYITVGPDHKLWFTLSAGSRIGRMSAIHGSVKNLALAFGPNFNGELATFIDGTPTATAADMSAAVDWGDGTSSSAVVSGPTGGPFEVSASHAYTALGNFNTSIKLHESVDNADYVATGTASITTPTSTVLSSSSNPAAPGATVTFTATVSTSFGIASGTVNFLDFGSLIGSGTLNGGTVTLMTASLTAGPHAIVAVYLGDTAHNASSSAELDEIIQGASQTSTTLGLAASGDLHFRSQKITLTATVVPGAGSAGGTINFYDGNRLLDSAPLDGSGQASINSDQLNIGHNALRAAYIGDNNFGGSISPDVVVYRSPRPH